MSPKTMILVHPPEYYDLINACKAFDEALDKFGNEAPLFVMPGLHWRDESQCSHVCFVCLSGRDHIQMSCEVSESLSDVVAQYLRAMDVRCLCCSM